MKMQPRQTSRANSKPQQHKTLPAAKVIVSGQFTPGSTWQYKYCSADLQTKSSAATSRVMRASCLDAIAAQVLP
jgi:hypothetical protein